MNVFLIVFAILECLVWMFFNAYVAHKYTAKRMKEDFIDSQTWFSKLLFNMFFAPAWILQGVYYVADKIETLENKQENLKKSKYFKLKEKLK